MQAFVTILRQLVLIFINSQGAQKYQAKVSGDQSRPRSCSSEVGVVGVAKTILTVYSAGSYPRYPLLRGIGDRALETTMRPCLDTRL